MSNSVFMLYASCRMVKGYQRTAIYDLQKGQIHFLPNSVADIFSDESYVLIEELLPELDRESKEILYEYLTFLNENELGFYCSKEDVLLFPKLSTEFRFPSHITNCILDAMDELWYFDEKLVMDLDQLCCDFIQIRYFGKPSLQQLSDIARKIAGSHLKNAEIILPENGNEYRLNDLLLLSKSCKPLQSWIHYNDQTNSIEQEQEQTLARIVRTTDNITGETHCGQVAQLYFSVNNLHYFESLSNNTCLNRKIAVDKHGMIKNCPSMSENFGSIHNTSLLSAINKAGFKDKWSIVKDEVETCRDCEFRHVCTDCRAYLEKPDDLTSKPLKCGYNPYTCEWSDWSLNPLKGAAMQHYNL